MSFIQISDYKSHISQRDFEALTALEDDFPADMPPVEVVEGEDEEEPDGAELPPLPAQTPRELAEANAMEEVASYLRGRFDMEAAYAQTGAARNRQLVQYVVDVALWNLSGKVAFAFISEVRETRYKAALAWLKLAETGKTNPDLPRYAPDPEKPQAHRLFRYGSNPVRSQVF
jgi:phage gp36-like protein